MLNKIQPTSLPTDNGKFHLYSGTIICITVICGPIFFGSQFWFSTQCVFQFQLKIYISEHQNKHKLEKKDVMKAVVEQHPAVYSGAINKLTC